ncbi:uncharacterized protein M421DRAFT_221764 [Didymella exigua CBS 183.55]|uniref:Uncharacterized protein n=1 Tax=Didymella exigua CBS 183.55 TaxID=1150837 RepID=A0A6A5RG71_9PLEO|nr:uncharacterized protein M421DRAFT_221764 [Didymella exigua CBS 183.55]KAF1926270.1 hypothetical protein M421DRAFT_221764 [Didymella exigua CBS 183.55]
MLCLRRQPKRQMLWTKQGGCGSCVASRQAWRCFAHGIRALMHVWPTKGAQWHCVVSCLPAGGTRTRRGGAQAASGSTAFTCTTMACLVRCQNVCECAVTHPPNRRRCSRSGAACDGCAGLESSRCCPRRVASLLQAA